MNGVILYGELDSDSAEAALQVGCYSFQVLSRDIGRVGVEFRKDLRHGFFHQVCNLDRVYILIVNDAQQGIQLVGRCVDDA